MPAPKPIKLPRSLKSNMFECPTLGADPEIFVRSGKKLLPAYEFLPSKHEGLSFSTNIWKTLGSLYWDGFQAEYSLIRGENCPTVLTLYQRFALQALLQAAQKHDPKARLVLENVVKIPTQTLQNEIDCYIELGCLPSFNAYNDSGIHVSNPRELLYRFAGGHVHIGPDDETNNSLDKVKVTKNLDMILGIWAVGAAQNWDNPIRRMYYGKAGEYRRPKHGLEYRTLSNFFLSSPYIFEMVYEIARAVYRASKGNALQMWAHDELSTRIAINECDPKLSASILKRNRALFRWLLPISLGEKVKTMIYNVGLYGIEYALKNPEDFIKNWELDNEHEWHYENDKAKFQLRAGIRDKLLVAQK